SEAERNGLESRFLIEEVKGAVDSLVGGKAPGPDGFPMIFFQTFSNILKKDVMDFMNEFYDRGRISKSLGASFITLIPKNPRTKSMSEFRPI
ncbi:hypothetical protein PJI17_31695, partial [Mycobacterium kansasii]